MFYNQIKNMFDKMHPLKRSFARNIVLACLFCLLTVASVGLKSQSTINSKIFAFTLGALIVNMVFAFVISRFRYAYLFYLFVATGGLCALLVLYLGAFEMIGWSNNLLLIFWILFIVSTILLIYINFINLDEKLLRDYFIPDKLKYTLNIERDIYENLNKKHGVFFNLIRIFIAPLAPAFGMALSRNFHGEQEWLIIGFMILLLALVLSTGYIRFFALSLKLLHWQRTLHSNIEITDSL